MGVTRRVLAAMAAAAALAACSPGGATGGAAAGGDMALGPADAKVTMIEYASVTCGHCADFHAQVLPELKKKYVDTGKLRYVFREFPTSPPELAAAGFQLARCGGADAETYFKRLDVLFKEQQALFEAYAAGQVRVKLDQIAAEQGIPAATFDACLKDPAAAQRITQTVEAGVKQFQITGTPTIVINGEVMPFDQNTLEGLSKRIDAKLGG
jgi:protein-disulfide isomerase